MLLLILSFEQKKTQYKVKKTEIQTTTHPNKWSELHGWLAISYLVEKMMGYPINVNLSLVFGMSYIDLLKLILDMIRIESSRKKKKGTN